MDTPPLRLDQLVSFVRSQHPDAGPLEHLAAAVRAAEYIGDVADHLIGHFVDEARRAGASWTQIGQSLGVSKQAAQKRFVPRAAESGLFGRFTIRARNVVVAAQEEARNLRHPYVDAAHVVLGLTHEPDSLAMRALAAIGVSADEVRAAAAAALPEGESAVGEHLPFTQRSKKLLELVTREALRLGHNYVGTEHILLGLLSLDGGGLVRLEVSKSAVEEWILAELANM